MREIGGGGEELGEGDGKRAEGEWMRGEGEWKSGGGLEGGECGWKRREWVQEIEEKGREKI